jgi:peptidoglycan/LPS O-acetylase OafA/YrhL
MSPLNIANIEATMKRPKGIAAIAVYYIVGATVMIPSALLEYSKERVFSSESALALLTMPILIVLSIGLWRMKNWARISAAVLTALAIVCAAVAMVLSGLLYYHNNWLLIALPFIPNLLIIAYLMSSSVRRAFLSPSLDVQM